MGIVAAPLNRPAPDTAAIAREIRQVMVEALGLRLEEHELSGVSRLTEAVAIDSVAALQFVVALERRFGIRMEEQWLDLERLGDLAALSAYVAERKNSSGAAAADG